MASVRRLLQRGRGSATLSVAGRPKRKSWLDDDVQLETGCESVRGPREIVGPEGGDSGAVGGVKHLFFVMMKTAPGRMPNDGRRTHERS